MTANRPPSVAQFVLNGEKQQAVVEDRLLLVDYIRRDKGLTGTHQGCDDGRCGACTVHCDGAAVKSCMMLVRQAEGCDIRTVESLGTPEALSPLQRAFRRHHGLQCGYCTPGMLMSAQALLDGNPDPTEAEVRRAIAGNLCRCTGYHNIVQSILAAAAELRGASPAEAPPPAEGGTRGWVGRGVERSQDARLLTGYGRYVADLATSATLHCMILRSPHAHARIKRIDVSRAQALPGVVDVVTGAQAASQWKPLPPVINIGMRLNTSYAIAVDKVVYHGEPVAAVAATDPYLAEDALAAIEVEYEPLPPVTSIAQALAADAPKLYADWPDNRCLEFRFSSGEVEAALARSAHRIKAKITHHRYTAAPIEGRVTLAAWDRGRRELQVNMSTQAPHQMRTVLAQTLDIAESSIRVIAQDVGGGFGLKLQADAEVIPCLLAMRTGRPVIWIETRAENLMSGVHARDYELEMDGGFDADGRITALRVDLVGNCGCDGTNRSTGAGQLLVGAFYFPGNYKVPLYENTTTGVVSNKGPYGAYRGYGKDIANHGIERFMEIAARRLGLPANELRRRNFIQPDEFPHTIATGAIYDSGDYPRLLAMAEAAMDLPRFRERQARARAQGRYLGVGFGMLLEPGGGSVPNCIFNAHETATVRMAPQGDFTLLTGIQDIGQGIETTYAQCLADELKVDPAAIRVLFGDTRVVPYGLGAWSSRGASFGVSAAVTAARKLVEKLSRIAALILAVDTSQVEQVEGGFAVRSAGAAGRRLSYRELGQTATLWPGPLVTVPAEVDANLEATHTWLSPIARWVPDAVGSLSIYNTHSSACYAVEVEVDIETGRIAVNDVYVAHDCGTVINPKIVEGQVHGGVVQGLGAALNEELRYDAAGRLLNDSFWYYMLPQAPDVPKIRIGHIECPSPNTALGAKGLGEGGPVGVPCTVMNAVEDALAPLRIELSELPLTPERILELIKARSAA